MGGGGGGGGEGGGGGGVGGGGRGRGRGGGEGGGGRGVGGGGQTLGGLARALVAAIEPEAIVAAARVADAGFEGGPGEEAALEAAALGLRERALAPFDNPALRRLLVTLASASEVVIDEISVDRVIGSAFSTEQAQAAVDTFAKFLEAERDTLVALRVLYGRPAAGRLTYAGLEELRDAMLRPPWLLQPLALWSAYRRLGEERARASPAKTLTDIVALVRFALGQREVLAPLSSEMAGRFNLWIGREGRAGREYDAAQLGWLEAIRDHLAANIEVTPADLQESFAGRGGVLGARRAFGARLDAVLEEMQDALVA